MLSQNFSLDNGSILITLSGDIVGKNSRSITVDGSDTGIVDDQLGTSYMGRVVLQEINPQSRDVLTTLQITSGLLKPMQDWYEDMYGFRAHNLSLYPWGLPNAAIAFKSADAA